MSAFSGAHPQTTSLVDTAHSAAGDDYFDKRNDALDLAPRWKAPVVPRTEAELATHIRSVMDKAMLPEDQVYNVLPGMAQAIWNNKYSRIKSDGSYQSWKERLYEVVGGNFMLGWNGSQGLSGTQALFNDSELEDTWKLAQKGIIAYAGRHLQHGDFNQRRSSQEKFTNCSTAICTFIQFKLGLDGSGIGADYSCAIRRVDWDNAPYIRCVISSQHPDFGKATNELQGGFDSLEEAREKYPSESETVRWFEVEDSCEGWVRAVAALETAAFHEKHREKLFIFDFSKVRGEGAPIRGQQNRPASGPLPLMRAFQKIASIRGAGMQPWKQAMFIDHYLASCIVLGGVRRMARMAVKYWKDRDIFDFIEIKRGGSLWSANNSILVDKEFWEQAQDRRTHAARVFQAATGAIYLDKSGEPGFINVDRFHSPTKEEIAKIDPANAINLDYYEGRPLHEKTYEMVAKLTGHALKQPYVMICNPCAEIAIFTGGGYCLVADVNGNQASDFDEWARACELTAQSLIRVNRMKSLYKQETERTNRIGVSLNGVHEAAYKFCGLTFYDLIGDFDEIIDKSIDELRAYFYDMTNNNRVLASLKFWLQLDNMRQRTEDAAAEYSKRIGMNVPATVTTMKPGGTVSKVVSVTECANLPAFGTYLRWVQYEAKINGVDNPEVVQLKNYGYPIKDVSVNPNGGQSYPGKVVVGFPTKLPIVDLMEDKVVTATEVSMEDHYKWLRLFEKFWLGQNEDGTPRNNQISYTLKWHPSQISEQEFCDMVMEHQSKIRCCSFDAFQTPDELTSAYCYAPEEPISFERYTQMMGDIIQIDQVGIDEDSLQCSSGVCPIEGNQVRYVDEDSTEHSEVS